MRSGKNIPNYGVLWLVGLAIGVIFLSRTRRRPKAIQPEVDRSRNEISLHDYSPGADRKPRGQASVAASHASSIRLEDPVPAITTEVAPVNKKEKGNEAQERVAALETKRPAWALSPKAARHRMHFWIQTTCAVVEVILIVFFGVALSHRLQMLIDAQHGSQKAMLALEQSSRTEQRAWVAMMDVVPLPLRPNGGGFSVKVQNSGKTPAFEVQLSAVITFADNGTLPDEKAPSATAPRTLLPGSAYTTDVLFRTSPEAVNALVKHEQRAVGWVWIAYTDVFKAAHASRACFYWYPDLKSVKPCEAFNEVN